LKRIRSGVDAPDAKDGLLGVGGARFAFEDVGGRGMESAPIVVLRCRFVVSAEGGGGR
jgi:hypothetical protein